MGRFGSLALLRRASGSYPSYLLSISIVRRSELKDLLPVDPLERTLVFADLAVGGDRIGFRSSVDDEKEHIVPA